MANTITPTTTVKYSLTNIQNKELISKNLGIFKYFYRTTHNPDLAAAMEKLSDVWYLKYGGVVYIYDVAMCPGF